MDFNIEKVADNLKDNAVPLLLGVGGVCVLLSLLSGKNKESELVPATGFISYPDAVTNANVIIGEVNDHTTAEVGNLADQHESIMDTLLGQNEYFKESIENVLGKADTSTNEVLGSIDKVQTSVNNVQQSVDNVNKNVTTQSSIIQSAVNKVQETVKKATTTTKKNTTTTAKKTSSGTYTYKTKSGLNTSTSIVDALKATGVDSSMATRKKIAQANGISNYTGTASQNVALLNKLKAGTLKKI